MALCLTVVFIKCGPFAGSGMLEKSMLWHFLFYVAASSLSTLSCRRLVLGSCFHSASVEAAARCMFLWCSDGKIGETIECNGKRHDQPAFLLWCCLGTSALEFAIISPIGPVHMIASFFLSQLMEGLVQWTCVDQQIENKELGKGVNAENKFPQWLLFDCRVNRNSNPSFA